ncbi:MAG TPA: hypothetical protein VKU03_12795 [Roseiarcus sp.]|nr:hypothetical protein [Roseiarcus sp.]
MPSNIFRFDESWETPGASVEEVYDVLSHGELLPLWRKGVYLDAQRISGEGEPKVGDQFRVKAR